MNGESVRALQSSSDDLKADGPFGSESKIYQSVQVEDSISSRLADEVLDRLELCQKRNVPFKTGVYASPKNRRLVIAVNERQRRKYTALPQCGAVAGCD